MSGSLSEFLGGRGRDGAGRTLTDVLAFDDSRLEQVHDYIQWLFPLYEASRAVPHSPVLDAFEAATIRDDPTALSGFQAGLERMRLFYDRNDHWLVEVNHNHLRISRILLSTRELLSLKHASLFHAFVLGRHQAAGSPINATSLDRWARAVH